MKPANKLLALAAIICVILVSACQKEFTAEDDLNPPHVGNDSNYLNKIYIIDSIAGVEDTSNFFTYFYDASGRVVRITDSIMEGGSWVLFNSVSYYYNGTDTLPFKSLNLDYEQAIAIPDPNAVDSTTIFHQYTSTGRNEYDSARVVAVTNFSPLEFETFIEIKKYQYNGNNIYTEGQDRDLAGTIYSHIKDTAQADANGNVVSSKRYNVIGGVSTLQTTSTLTYDNRPNPFALLSNFRTLSVVPFGETFFHELQSKNNRLKALEISTGGTFDEDLTGKYRFNINGYPEYIVDEDAPGEFFKIKMTYRDL